MTLYRASSKILESSALVKVEDGDDDDDDVEILGTDGRMKDMGGGKFVVVKSRKAYEAPLQAKRKLEEGSDLVERAGKRVCTSLDEGADLLKTDRGMFVSHLLISMF